MDVGEPAEDVEHLSPRQGRFRRWLPTEHASIVPRLVPSLKMAAADRSFSASERSEEVVLLAGARLRLREPLEPDAGELAGGRVPGEAG
jgi:hypothetical protein